MHGVGAGWRPGSGLRDAAVLDHQQHCHAGVGPGCDVAPVGRHATGNHPVAARRRPHQRRCREAAASVGEHMQLVAGGGQQVAVG